MADPWLEGPVTTSAFGWRLERTDGVTLGFTSHDCDVQIDGLLYWASPGLVPTSIVETSGLETNGLDVKGALTSDAIRADDLRAGKWDGATLDVFLFDWSNPDSSKRQLASGTLGSIEFAEDSFSADVAGPAAKLSMPVAPYTSPTCRARFCDARCGLNAERFRRRTRVTGADDSHITVANLSASELNRYVQGELRWTSGRNCGLRHSIIGATANRLILDRPLSFELENDAQADLLEGCDKLLITCASRFSNIVNFRGEPHLPGNDLLTRFPSS
ncbi:MAG: DUF2163 domain-containing protein [Sphingorhabdus sp.]